jgi:hypothetical protein
VREEGECFMRGERGVEGIGRRRVTSKTESPAEGLLSEFV